MFVVKKIPTVCWERIPFFVHPLSRQQLVTKPGLRSVWTLNEKSGARGSAENVACGSESCGNVIKMGKWPSTSSAKIGQEADVWESQLQRKWILNDLIYFNRPKWGVELHPRVGFVLRKIRNQPWYFPIRGARLRSMTVMLISTGNKGTCLIWQLKYPLVNKHSNGKSPFLMGKSTINGHF